MAEDSKDDNRQLFHTALVIDDHPLFCDALAMTLEAVTPIERTRVADSLETALHSINTDGAPDVVVLDLNLPDVDGFDGLIRIKTATDVPVLVVSSMSDARVITSALQAGAAGFVPKHSARDVFAAAFEVIASGSPFVPEGCDLLDEELNTQSDITARLSSLTNQQARILHQICEGKLNKQIAFDLSIAETTVKAHVTAIMRKLGVQSRTQAVLIAKETSFATLLQDTP